MLNFDLNNEHELLVSVWRRALRGTNVASKPGRLAWRTRQSVRRAPTASIAPGFPVRRGAPEVFPAGLVERGLHSPANPRAIQTDTRGQPEINATICELKLAGWAKMQLKNSNCNFYLIQSKADSPGQ